MLPCLVISIKRLDQGNMVSLSTVKCGILCQVPVILRKIETHTHTHTHTNTHTNTHTHTQMSWQVFEFHPVTYARTHVYDRYLKPLMQKRAFVAEQCTINESMETVILTRHYAAYLLFMLQVDLSRDNNNQGIKST